MTLGHPLVELHQVCKAYEHPVLTDLDLATPNGAALALLDDAVRNDRTVYPSDADLENAEFQVDVGEAITVYEKYWEMLKAGG